MRDIRKTIAKFDEAGRAEFSRLNFEPRDYIDERGKPQVSYDLTEQGFTAVVVAYTDVRSMRYKADYIDEFVRMRNKLNELAAEKARLERELAAKQAAQDAQHKLMVKEKVRPLDWVQDPHTTFLRLYRNMDRMLGIGHFKHLNPEITTAKDAFNRILSRYEAK